MKLIDILPSVSEEQIRALEGEFAPWYVRLLSGVVSWVAAALILGFLLAAHMLKTDSSLVIYGFLLMGAACVLSRIGRNVAMEQGALAASFSGQVLFLMGVYELLGHPRESGVVFYVGSAMEIILVFANADRLHRFLVTGLALTFFFVGWGFANHGLSGIGLCIVWAVGGVLFWLISGDGIPAFWFYFLRPAGVASFIVLPLLAFSEWQAPSGDFAYTHQVLTGIATVLLIVFLYVRLANQRAFLVVSCLFVLALAWITSSSPAIMLAAFMIGTAFHARSLPLLGYSMILLGLGVFQFYYEMGVSLLIKSYILMGSGLVLAAAWMVLRYLVGPESSEEEKDKSGVEV
ncbi:MAG TPA: DUF4401 domain-containing protein [Leptospiraceae bacterium]|jgi:hypothetical protein|nr:DUF4401 domain-containing protein [Leptospirales bacterium]HMY43907.1 DUF4401 domain-containing protein [Leptospiraceae bacterium]HNE23903.1 DUF4401 domain-containing protein [Leptospiraceae bacterium]HNJ32984.1 DUF4401 domain-containing protein [Leptospiraceae bacterium]HNL02762.1 DUF4401 domain-containing protein [Leptospiraceae bacterium]